MGPRRTRPRPSSRDSSCGKCASSERVAAAAASGEKPLAQRPRTPASTVLHGCEARPRGGRDGHLPDQASEVGADLRPAAARPRWACPVPREAAAMPSDDRPRSETTRTDFRSDDAHLSPIQNSRPGLLNGASIGRAGRSPVAAAAPDCREPIVVSARENG